MKTNTTYNGDTIISAKVIANNEVFEIRSKKYEFKYTWYFKRYRVDFQEPKFYSIYDFNEMLYYKAEVESGDLTHGVPVQVRNDKAYWRPCVEITFFNKRKEYKYFDTYEEALEFKNQTVNKYIKYPLNDLDKK